MTQLISVEFVVKGARVGIVLGDLTEQVTDAIVNAANSSLMGGGGVDGAIHRKGGPRILEECNRIRASEWPKGLAAGEAVVTSGGNLKARYVVHTVGPVWHGGRRGEAEILRASYWNSLRLALSKGVRTIAFPAISTGAYGYPVDKACRVALSTVKEFLEKEGGLDEVVLVLFAKSDFELYVETASMLLGARR